MVLFLHCKISKAGKADKTTRISRPTRLVRVFVQSLWCGKSHYGSFNILIDFATPLISTKYTVYCSTNDAARWMWKTHSPPTADWSQSTKWLLRLLKVDGSSHKEVNNENSERCTEMHAVVLSSRPTSECQLCSKGSWLFGSIIHTMTNFLFVLGQAKLLSDKQKICL